MKIYRTCFFTKNASGENVSHYPTVIMQKIPGKSAYRVKWDFVESLEAKSNKATVVSGDGYLDAMHNFVAAELPFHPAEFVDTIEIKL